MAIQFGHQRLAKPHDLAVAFPFRIKIAAAFAAAHGQCGQGILEGLLKAEEFKNGQVNRRVETHPAFIRADSRVELNAPCPVNLHLVTIVHPDNPKLDHAFRFNQTFQQRIVAIARVLLDKRPQSGHHLANGLRELNLVWIARSNGIEKLRQRECLSH